MTLGRAASPRAPARQPWARRRGGGFVHRRECSDKPRRGAAPDRGVCNASRPCSTRLSTSRSAFQGCSAWRRRAPARATSAAARQRRRSAAAALRRRSSAARRRTAQRQRRRGRASAARRPPRQAASRAAPSRRRGDPRAARRSQAARVDAALAPAPSASCGWPPAAASSTAGSRDALRAPARPRVGSVGGSGSATRWQRLRIVGSKRVGRGRAEQEARRRRRLLERLQEGVGGDRVHRARPDGSTTTLPRPRADVVCARRRSPRAPPRPGSPCSACACRAFAASSPPSSAAAQPSDSRSASGTQHQQVGMRARRAPAGSSRSARTAVDQRRGRRFAQPAPGRAPARARTGRRRRGPCSSSACALLRLERCGAAASASQGSDRLAVGARQPSARASQRASS